MYIHVNAATSVDGKLSTRQREQVAISGSADFDRVEQVRAEADAILVGVGTVLADDPSLLSHDERHRRNIGKKGIPARVVADSRARTPPDADIFAGPATTYLLVAEAAPDDRVEALATAGAEILTVGDDRVDLHEGVAALETRGHDRMLVEGGGEIIFSLFEDGLVDALTLFVGSIIIGGREAPTLADGTGFVTPDDFPALALRDVERIDDGVLLAYDVPN